MKKILISLSILALTLNLFAADNNNCSGELQSIINPNSPIEFWGEDYQPCLRYEWELMFPDDWNSVEFDYTIDLNPIGAIDMVLIYMRDASGQEREILNYLYQPITGKITIPIYSPGARIVFISDYGNSGELYRGFKLAYRQGSSMSTDQVFYSNVGIGIQPQERLHVNGAIRGDGEGGSLRIRTTAGTTEIGAADSVYSHFYTDRSAFFFNKPLYIAKGTIASYGYPNSLNFQTNDTNRMVINSEGDIEILGNIHLNGAINGADKYNQAIRVKSNYGYADMGAVNAGYFHFYTDRPGFYFGKTLTINGGKIRSASGNNLYLNTFDTTRVTILNKNGNVGIGVDDPQEKLHVNGAIRGNGSYGALQIKTSTGNMEFGPMDSGYARFKTNMSTYHFDRRLLLKTGELASETKLTFFTNNSTHCMTMLTNGNVGIGTTNPSYNLDVNGNIRAKKIYVTNTLLANEIIVKTMGADFVFAEDYQLRPLSEVKAFIEENKHLPEIKSAQEMQENGVSVNELQTQLLQKIEELTLYLIQQEQTILEMRQELEQLKK